MSPEASILAVRDTGGDPRLPATEAELTELVTSINGISAVGAAAILAETGDPARFTTARGLVKHAGLAPREKLSGNFVGRTKLTGQGRPRLRVAACQCRCVDWVHVRALRGHGQP